MEGDPPSEAGPRESADGAVDGLPAVHDHAWRSITVGTMLAYSEYECSLCGITWSL